MESYEKMAEIYDELINEDIDYEGFAESILNICKNFNLPSEDYLDLGCGTGNLSIIISKYFKHTYLVDSSEAMLAEAFDKFKSNKLKPRIVCQNMCDLYLNRKFDLITCTLDATNYIIEDEDLEKYFISVKKHLKDNGLFIFDINSYYKLSNILGNNIFVYNNEEVFYSWENSFKEDILEMYLTFFIKKGDFYERFDEEHVERAYKEEDIESMLKKLGFDILKKLDNYKEDPIKKTTERIVYVTKLS